MVDPSDQPHSQIIEQVLTAHVLCKPIATAVIRAVFVLVQLGLELFNACCSRSGAVPLACVGERCFPVVNHYVALLWLPQLLVPAMMNALPCALYEAFLLGMRRLPWCRFDFQCGVRPCLD